MTLTNTATMAPGCTRAGSGYAADNPGGAGRRSNPFRVNVIQTVQGGVVQSILCKCAQPLKRNRVPLLFTFQ